MNPTQWLLAVFFGAFIALKALEAGLQLESWPLTHNPMFSARIPPAVVPWRITLLGTTRGGRRFELRAADFNLSEDELNRQLLSSYGLRVKCGELGRLYNDTHPEPQRLTAMRARAEKVLRPGVPGEPFARTFRCPLDSPSGPG